VLDLAAILFRYATQASADVAVFTRQEKIASWKPMRVSLRVTFPAPHVAHLPRH
jgi:hypothetical protein